MSKAGDYRKSLYGSPNTVKTKLSMFNNHIAPFSTIGRDPDDIVRQCIKSWKEDDLSLATVKSCFVVLGEYMKMTYDITLDKKRLMFQHFQDTPRPQTKVKAWTQKEANTVLTMPVIWSSEEHHAWDMVRTYLNTGLRKGELLGLVWADIDFLNGVIRVQRSKDFATSRVGPTKTKKFRTVPMNHEVEEILTRRYNVGVAEVEFVFPHRDVNCTLEWICHHAKVTPITTHGLRHTFATTLLERSFSPKYVSELLGHDKLSTTLDIYWSYLPNKHKLEDIYGDS